jgi:ribosomal protein L16 Arg81 hydroxylase
MTTTLEAESAQAETAGLAGIVGDPDAFLAGTWDARPRSFRCRALPGTPAPADIWAQFDCGLFVTPYFSVVRDGRAVPLGAVTETRIVQQQPRVGYADGAAVREHFAAGHTVRLNQPEHWHPGLKELVAALREDLRAAVRSALFLSPAGTAGTPARTGDGHVLVVQLRGRTDWETADDGGERAAFALGPGEALYVPAGWTYGGSVGAEESLHLLLSVTRPGPRDLARTAVDGFLESAAADAVAGTHHYLSLAQKVAWLRAELAAHLSAQDTGELVRRAVRAHQGTDEA